MTGYEFESSAGRELATPEQAAQLLEEVRELLILQGRYFELNGTHDYHAKGVTVPSEIAARLPEPEDTSIGSQDSISVNQTLDGETGLPRFDDVIGQVTFTRKEDIDTHTSHITRLKYRMILQNSGIELERHITSTEHGLEQREASNRSFTRYLLDPEEAMRRAAAAEEAVARKKAVYAEEKARGLLDVTQTEAQQIIDYLRGINQA